MKEFLKHIACTLLFAVLGLSGMAQEKYSFKNSYDYLRSDGQKASIKLVTKNDSLSLIQYFIGGKKSDEWKLKYPVYQFECGDINGDSIPEIAVGVTKRTRYSRFMAKRLFIFKLFDEEVIRPLWLGSRVSHELVDFHFEPIGDKCYIHTIEKSKDGETLELRYKLTGFGLKFHEYVTKTE